MPTVWRITKQRYVATAFDGEGARRFGGRWNSPGNPAVYASESRALALLEVLAGLGDATPMGSYVLVPADVPDELVERVDPGSLEEGWAQQPPGPASQNVGDVWLLDGRSLALRVPSVIVPGEFNFLLSPLHPHFGSISIGEPVPLPIDSRLSR